MTWITLCAMHPQVGRARFRVRRSVCYAAQMLLAAKPDAQTAAWSLLELRRLLLPLQGKARVLLFGSWARGDATRLSDIDIAIDPLEPLLEPLPPGLLGELREAIEESRVPYRVDLVDLGAATTAFRARVLSEAIVWTG